MTEPDILHIYAHLANQHRLPMWVICRPITTDYPGQWTARMHFTIPAHETTDFLIVAATLDEVRDLLPPGLFMLSRDPDDDPVVEEVWL